MNATPSTEFNLNEKFAPLFTNTEVRFFILTGGRGSGKSFIVANMLANIFEKETPHVTLYTRQTMTAADQSVVPEFEGMLEKLGYDEYYWSAKDDLFHDKGNKVLFRGIMSGSKNMTARLKSIPGLSMWIVDEAEEMDDEKSFDTINFSIRQSGVKNRVIISMNPCHVSHFIWRKFFKSKMPDGSDVPQEYNGIIGNVCYIHTTYLENIQNLDRDFIVEALTMKKTDFKKYQHLFLGHWQHELDGALWNAEMIKAAKEKEVNEDDVEMIAIGIDPSVSDAESEEQDEAGIVVVGKTWQGDYLVYEDASGVMATDKWGMASLEMFIQLDADYLVPEINNGGDLVEMNLRNCAEEFEENGLDKDALPIEPVRATKGKLVRADPVATLYKRGKVAHAPGLGKLEAQLQSYTGAGQPSPGRLDALVWSITFLSKKHLPKIRSG